MAASSLYPLPLHFSLMETLYSFTSLLSITSFKLFSYFPFLTSPLFPSVQHFQLFFCPSSPSLPRSSAVSTGLWVISIVSRPHHITQQLVTGNQSACLASLDAPPHSPTQPPLLFLALVFLTSLVSRRLLVLLCVSGVITLRNHSPLPFPLGPVEGIYATLPQTAPPIRAAVSLPGGRSLSHLVPRPRRRIRG